ncbi:hypothetical protein ABMA27_016996 [Loxostege sticticalis]|uniref:PHD-type domain-containing protein n=1 Tax=Loxostege sticticalis TaxID=481309 RepID=A0ABR3GZD6_LOXSC
MATRQWGCCTNVNEDNGDRYTLCSICEKAYHSICLALPDDEIISAVDWICPSCKIKLPRASKDDDTPTRNVSNSRGSKRPALNSPPEMCQTSVTRDDLRNIVQEITQAQSDSMLAKINSNLVSIIGRELKPLKSDISELKASMSFISDQYDILLSEHKEMKDTVNALHSENSKLQAAVAELSSRVNTLEQSARANNIEIQCVPESKNENVINIVRDLGKAIACDIADKEILSCTRIAKINRSNPRPRSIVVQVSSPRIRDQFIASSIKYNKANPQNKLNSSLLGFTGKITPIYVTEHLSPANKALHASTRLKAKEKHYKYVWVRNGKILTRKNDESEYIVVKSISDLDRLV